VIKDYFMHYETINNDFTINLGSSKLTYHKQHQENDWNITLVDTGINTLKGGRIKRIERFLTDEINFVTYGDGVANINIKELLEFHKNHGKVITITGVHPPARFGELLEKNNLLVSFQEKPQTSKGLINGGFMVFNRGLLNYLTPNEDCDFEIGPLENLSKEGKVMVYKHQGQWECMDHERDVAHLNKLWNENKAFWKIW
jgi:glucose-1-phosphate cytidylyltransferase